LKEVGKHPERGLLAQLVLEDYPLKLLALGLSIALYALVHSDQDAQRTMSCDVIAVLPSANSSKVLISAVPTKVNVTLRGPSSRLNSLQHTDLTPIQLNLRDSREPVIRFDASSISVPERIQVVGIDPPVVQLSWRARAERTIPVRVQLLGTPAAGFEAAVKNVIGPSVVVVSGPADEVASIANVFTDEVGVAGLAAGSHRLRAKRKLLAGHLAYIDVTSLEVQIEVRPAVGERVIRDVELAKIGSMQVTLRPTAVSVALRGSTVLLDSIDANQLVPYVELPETLDARTAQMLDVKLRGVPEGVSIHRIVPSSVVAKRR
jgi:hypothetical protein